MAMVISGSLFFFLLPSGFVVFPERKQDRSFDSFPSLCQLNFNLGVTSEEAGSLSVRSMDEPDGWRKVCCGISKSQDAGEFQVFDLYRTRICWSGLYSWMINSVGSSGSGGGATPPFRRTASCERVGCVHCGFRSTSPYKISGL